MAAQRYTIVRLPPQTSAVYFVVPLVSDSEPASEYMVDEGACPTTWLRDIELIVIDGDTDPHGLFEHVRDIGELEFVGRAHNADEEWRKVIPEAFSGKTE